MQPNVSELVLELRRLSESHSLLIEEHRHALRWLVGKKDREVAQKLLPWAAALTQDRPFHLSILDDLAGRKETREAQLLHELLDEHRDADGGLSGIGWMFVRLEGVALCGLRVLRAGDRGPGALWRIARVSPPK